MRHRVFFPLMLLIAAAMIVAALSWPQGLGRPNREVFHATGRR